MVGGSTHGAPVIPRYTVHEGAIFQKKNVNYIFATIKREGCCLPLYPTQHMKQNYHTTASEESDSSDSDSDSDTSS